MTSRAADATPASTPRPLGRLRVAYQMLPRVGVVIAENQGIPASHSRSSQRILLKWAVQALLSQMDLTKIISALRDERERVVAAIKTIERLVQRDGPGSSIKKRGRPPGSRNKTKASSSQT
jgi:hypothetical protein